MNAPVGIHICIVEEEGGGRRRRCLKGDNPHAESVEICIPPASKPRYPAAFEPTGGITP